MDWDWVRENAWAVWLGLSLVLGGAELFSLDLVLLMLAVGALVGMATALAGLGIPLQLLAAAAASVAMLALVRPGVVKRLHGGPDLKHGPAALIGQEGFAVAEVSARSGQVKLAGEIWTARPYDDSAVIPVGARVQVFEIRGATAYVHEVPEIGS
jgi:membrane protein implicated in regulation of membrane protease activity